MNVLNINALPVEKKCSTKRKYDKVGTLNYPETNKKRNQGADRINRNNKSKIIEHFCRRVPKFGIDKTEQI